MTGQRDTSAGGMVAVYHGIEAKADTKQQGDKSPVIFFHRT
jgi:hypothetical protein